MRVTEVSKIYSVNYLFDYDGTPGKYAQNENDEYCDDFEM